MKRFEAFLATALLVLAGYLTTHFINGVWRPDKYSEQNPCLILRNGEPIRNAEFLASFQVMKEKLDVVKDVPLCQAPILLNPKAVGEFLPSHTVIFFRSDFVSGALQHTRDGGWGPFRNATSVTITNDVTDAPGVRSFTIGHELAHYILGHGTRTKKVSDRGRSREEDEADALALAVLGDRAFRNTECTLKYQGSICFDNWNESEEIEARLGRLHAIARQRMWEDHRSACQQAPT